jgi:hypothetical protein
VLPRQFDIGHQQPATTVAAEARLEGHEDPRRLFVAGDALAVEQLDPRDGAATALLSDAQTRPRSALFTVFAGPCARAATIGAGCR